MDLPMRITIQPGRIPYIFLFLISHKYWWTKILADSKVYIIRTILNNANLATGGKWPEAQQTVYFIKRPLIKNELTELHLKTLLLLEQPNYSHSEARPCYIALGSVVPNGTTTEQHWMVWQKFLHILLTNIQGDVHIEDGNRDQGFDWWLNLKRWVAICHIFWLTECK